MRKLSKIVSLLALAGLCLFACKHPTDGGISDGGGTEIPSETTKPDTGGTGGSGTSGTETESGGESLPGTAGGSSNVKDIFAGKTFYDNADESKAKEKYVFGTDGTYTVFSKSDSGALDKEYREYKYSLSDDGKFYAAVNKIPFGTSSTTKELMTYQEIKDFINSEEAKASAKTAWDTITSEQQAEILKAAGLQETATFEDFWNVGIEESLEEYKEKFLVINVYDITEETDTDGSSYKSLSGTVDSSSTDLSKMAFSGYFSSIFPAVLISQDHSARVQNSSKTYWTTQIDSSKLYFKEEKGTETFEATYSVAGSGKDTEITVELPADKGGSVTLTFYPESIKLYEPKSSGTGESGSIGIERLPGTAGGSANSKNIFAGKTFYDNADKLQANEKYVFGTDGTFTSYWRSNSEPTFTDSSDSINPTCEYKYSLSSDGNIIYYAISKTSVEIDDAGNEQLMSYDEVCKAGKDEYKEDFFGVRMYEISEKTDDDGNSYTYLSGTVDSSSGDLSKMAFGGCFENVAGTGLKIDGTEHKFKFFINFYGSEIQLGETTHAAYKTTKIDSSKLYFEKCLYETTTDADAFEVAYNVTGSGKDTEITVELPDDKGGSVTLKFSPSEWKLYAPKSSESGGTETPSDPVTTYTVKFDANGGTGTMSDVTLDSQTYTLPAEAEGISAPEEKTFGGWATSKDGTAISEKTITLTESETTLYAVWKDTLYTVSLDSFDAAKKINVIKAVREITGLGLGEAKALVEGAPKTLKEGVSKADADSIIAKITEAGGTASYKKE